MLEAFWNVSVIRPFAVTRGSDGSNASRSPGAVVIVNAMDAGGVALGAGGAPKQAATSRAAATIPWDRRIGPAS
jgi:hypothetical protein